MGPWFTHRFFWDSQLMKLMEMKPSLGLSVPPSSRCRLEGEVVERLPEGGGPLPHPMRNAACDALMVLMVS